MYRRSLVFATAFEVSRLVNVCDVLRRMDATIWKHNCQDGRVIKRLILLLLAGFMPILAQAKAALPPLAVEYQGSLYVVNRVPDSADDLPAALTQISDVPMDYFNAAWSPDGMKLA